MTKTCHFCTNAAYLSRRSNGLEVCERCARLLVDEQDTTVLAALWLQHKLGEWVGDVSSFIEAEWVDPALSRITVKEWAPTWLASKASLKPTTGAPTSRSTGFTSSPGGATTAWQRSRMPTP